MKVVGKKFANKKEELQYLYDHKDVIKEAKKSILKTENFAGGAVAYSSTNKAVTTSTDGDTETVIKRTLVLNTYLWLDSHSDIHIKGIFSKSIQENKSTILHLHDHINRVEAKVGTPTSIREEEFNWTDLGIDKSGTTTALIMDSDIKKAYNEGVFEMYKDADINQHSVGMRYVKLDLALSDPDFEDEFKVWNEIIDHVANKQAAIDQGYFWAIREAKLIEGSAVTRGSNPVTPTLEAKDIEPSNDTQNKGSREDTSNHSDKMRVDHNKDLSTFIKNLK